LKSLEIISLYRPAAPTGTPPEPLLLLLSDHLLHSFESTLLLLPVEEEQNPDIDA
jgi:hypothetical protein